MFTPLALIITAIMSAFLWKENFYWGRSILHTPYSISIKLNSYLSLNISSQKNLGIMIHIWSNYHRPLFCLVSTNYYYHMEKLKDQSLIFVAVLVGLFCWWGGSTVSCGGRTKRIGKAKQTNKDKKPKRNLYWSALHITEQWWKEVTTFGSVLVFFQALNLFFFFSAFPFCFF